MQRKRYLVFSGLYLNYYMLFLEDIHSYWKIMNISTAADMTLNEASVFSGFEILIQNIGMYCIHCVIMGGRIAHW